MQSEATLFVGGNDGCRGSRGRIEIGRDFFGCWTVDLYCRGATRPRRSLSADTERAAWTAVMMLAGTLSGKDRTRPMIEAVPDISIPIWAAAPLLPWRDF